MNKFALFFKRSSPLLCLFLTFVACTACKKDKLTPETHTGANTFSCKINGAIFKPGYQELFGPTPLIGNMSTNSNGFDLDISACNQQLKPFQEIDIHLTSFNGLGTYTVKNNQLYFTYISYQYNLPFDTNLTGVGTLTLTRYDQANHIASGTFSFAVASKENPNNIIQITDGRFDIQAK